MASVGEGARPPCREVNLMAEACHDGVANYDRGYQRFSEQIGSIGNDDRIAVIGQVFDCKIGLLRKAMMMEEGGLESSIEEYKIFIAYLTKEFPGELRGVFKRGIRGAERIISSHGVQILLDCLRDKGSLEIDCVGIKNMKAFEKYLARICREFDDIPVGTKMGVVLRSSSTAHQTPIYMERSSEGIDVFIPDSLGENSLKSDGYYTRILQAFSGLTIPTRIFVSNVIRQCDDTSCPVISVNDMQALSKHEDLFGFLEESGDLTCGETEDGVHYQLVNRLPTSLMSMTQSRSKLTTYMERYPLDREELLGTVEKLLAKNRGRTTNWNVSGAYFRYERDIISRVVGIGQDALCLTEKRVIPPLGG